MHVIAGTISFELADFTYDAVYEYRSRRAPVEPDNPASGYMLELPVLLRALEQIEMGAVSAAEVRDAILASLRLGIPDGGCCPLCADYQQSHLEALAAYESAMARERQRAQTMTSHSHPFLVNTAAPTVHTWDCRSAPRDEIRHPGKTLTEFTHGDPDDEWDCPAAYEYTATARSVRMTAEELAEWIRRRRGPKGAANYRRCKVCQPALPIAYTSEAIDHPGFNGSAE